MHFALQQWQQNNIEANKISRIKKKGHSKTMCTSAGNNFISSIQYGIFQQGYRTPDFLFDPLRGRGHA
jgi:hypothetical protein